MSKKILVVDDEPDLLKVTLYRLEKAGYKVISAVNGKEALELITKESPDLVLLDLRLPLFNGMEVCLQAKNDDKLRNIPIILFTASSGSIEDKVKQCGAQGYIIKPFTPEELFEKVKQFIG